MSECLFHLCIFALGMSFSLLALPRLGIAVSCIHAYPTGLALWVIASLFILFFGLPFGAGTLFSVVAVVAASGIGGFWWIASRSGRPRAHPVTRPVLWRLALAIALASGATWLATLHDRSIWTYDSHTLMAIARSIAHHGAILPELAIALSSRGTFQVLVQASSLFFEEPYFAASPLLLGVAFLAAFAILAVRGLAHGGRQSAGAVAATLLTTAAIASPYFFVVQAFYIHEAFAGGIYLFLAVVSFWFAELERETTWLPFGFLYLLAFALHRVDGPIVGMIVLAIVYPPSRLPARAMRLGLLSYAGVIVAWLGLLVWLVGSNTAFVLRPYSPLLDRDRMTAIIVAYVFSTGVLFYAQRFLSPKVREGFPALVLGLLACGFVAGAIWRPSWVGEGLLAFLGNTASLSWGGIWYLFLILAVLCFWLPRVPHHYILAYGSGATLLFILLLPSVQHFSVKWSDSGNRMLTYLIPVTAFYLLMAHGRALIYRGRTS